MLLNTSATVRCPPSALVNAEVKAFPSDCLGFPNVPL